MRDCQRKEGWGLSKIGEEDIEIQIASYKINKPWGMSFTV